MKNTVGLISFFEKKIIFYFIFSILICTTTLAQSVLISDDVSVRNDAGYVIVGKFKEKTLLFRDRVLSFEIQAYDNQMHLDWKKNLAIDSRRGNVMDVVAGKDCFTAIVKYKLRGNTQIKLHRYNAEAKEIDTISVKDYGQRYTLPAPQSVMSEDKTKLLIYNILEDQQIEATVVDLENNKIVWDQVITTQHTDLKRMLKHCSIDNYGSIHFVFFDEKSLGIFKSEDDFFEILEYGPGYASVTNQLVEIKNYHVYDQAFKYDNVNHRLLCAGLYSDKNREKAVGYFTFNLSTTHPEAYQILFVPFDDAFIASTLGKEETTQKGIMDSKIQDLVLRKDGGVLLLLEEVRRLERTSNLTSRSSFNNSAMMHITTDYYYEDILAIAVNPDGSEQWKNVLHKRQFSQDDDAIFSSYGVFKTPSGLRLLYNDEINVETTTSAYQLRGNGSMERNTIFSTDRQDVFLRFRDALQVSSNEVIVPSEYRAELKLVRIRF